MYAADEFHRFVTAGDSHGEQSFLDTCRSFNASCALSSQSIASIEHALAGMGGDYVRRTKQRYRCCSTTSAPSCSFGRPMKGRSAGSELSAQLGRDGLPSSTCARPRPSHRANATQPSPMGGSNGSNSRPAIPGKPGRMRGRIRGRPKGPVQPGAKRQMSLHSSSRVERREPDRRRRRPGRAGRSGAWGARRATLGTATRGGVKR